MTEWQLIEDEDFIEAPDSPESNPAKWQWLAFGLVMVALLGGGAYWLLQSRRYIGRSALRADLSLVILEEQRLQYLGDRQGALDFMVPAAPDYWRDAYRNTFSQEAGFTPQGAELINVDFDGRCAVVEVAAAGSQQLRAYCLHEGSWRRAPLPPNIWGAPQTIDLGANLRLTFRERDHAFGQTLLDELQSLTASFERWAIPPPLAGENGLEVIVEPRDLAPPLLKDRAGQIVLNSPLVSLVEGSLGAETAGRLALVEALLSRTPPFTVALSGDLPGQDRLLAAARSVMAHRIGLSPADLARQTANRRERLASLWFSPFLATKNNDYANSTALSGQITIDHLASSFGPRTIGRLVEQIPHHQGWDSLFMETIGQATLELESDIIASLQQEQAVILRRVPPLPQGRELPNPLPAIMLRIDEKPQGGERAFVALPEQIAPLVVEIPPGPGGQTADQLFIPARCIPPDSSLTVTGTWLEKPYRLLAEHLLIEQVMPLSIRTAPDDTIAYFIEGESSAEQTGWLNNLFLSSQANPPPLPPSRWLYAVRPEGGIRPLSVLDETTQVVALPRDSGQPLQLLFTVNLPRCEQTWFVLFDPLQGIAGQWLGPPNPLQWLWRPDQKDILFFVPREAGQGFNVYRTGQAMGIEPVSQTSAPVVFLGWNSRLDRPINALAWFHTTYIGTSDLTTGGLDRIYSYFEPIRAPHLSPQGDWLLYLAGSEDTFMPATRLGLLNIATRQNQTLIEGGRAAGLAFPTWSPYLDRPALAVLSGPVVEGDAFRPNQLLILRPGQPDQQPIVLTQTASSEALGAPIFCADESMLYRRRHGDKYQLIHHYPGLRARPLLARRRVFRPLACSETISGERSGTDED